MLDWLKRRESPSRTHVAPDAGAASRSRSVAPGAYLALYTYLEKRYADTVVLTFAEIEDLLGFSLPDLARLRREWWTDPETGPPGHAQSWIQASRTAKPNLLAQTVAFDRAS
jgi:hypothetical protein